MVDGNGYLGRIRTYRTYLRSEIKKYKEISDGESLQGSMSADQKVSVLEKALTELDSTFPESNKSN